MNELIERLNALPSGIIYTIAPKQYVSRGYQYYRHRCLVGFAWSKDRQILKAKVKGSRLYSVSISAVNGRLTYGCSCPAWTPVTQCKHVICALMTIKNIMDPNLFNMGSMGKEYSKTLASQLIISTKEEPLKKVADSFSIIIEKKYPFDFFEISLRQGNRIIDYSIYSLPEELQWIVNSGYSYFASRKKIFIDYLKSHGSAHPLILILDDKDIPLEWAEGDTFSSIIHLDITQDRVSLKKVFHQGEDICKKPYLLGNRLIIDLERKMLGLLEEKNARMLWELWSDETGPRLKTSGTWFRRGLSYGYRDPCREDGQTYSIEMPLKDFQRDPFILPDEHANELDDLKLTVNGKATSLERGRQGYSVSIEMDRAIKDTVSLKVWCDLEGVRSSTTRSFFSYLHLFGSGWEMSTPLKARKRRMAMMDAFMRLLSAKTMSEAKGVIKDTLSKEDFKKRRVKSEAKAFLMNAYTHLQGRSSRLQFANGRWHLLRNEKDEEKIPYIILSNIFGVDCFLGMRSHNEIAISTQSLYDKLSALSLLLKESNIPLSFNDTPVKTATLSCSIDLSRSSEIDWFELKPEIRCSGEVIGEKEWLKILANSGVLEKKDYIQILDLKGNEILKAIASIYGVGQATKDNKRDIVRVPRLKILDWITLRNTGVKVTLPKEDEEIIERLTEFKRIEKKPIPAPLKSLLRPYQREAYYWLSFLYEHRFGACLADDMGLGKTIEAISLLAGIKEGMIESPKGNSLLHLIVVPPSLLFNWENEIKRFYPDLKIHLYTGSIRILDLKDCDIVLTSYGIVRRDIGRLKEIQFNVIIFDEAQAIKNIYAKTTSAARQLNGYFKLTMTGTPLENHLGEYYSILDLALPGLLGGYDDFKPLVSSSKKPDHLEGILPSLDVILNRAKPFVLRRRKDEILKELPPKVETDIYLETTDKQKAFYKKTVEMVRDTISEAYNTKTKAQAQIIALTAILRLRQICVSPKLLDPSLDERSPKIVFLIERIKELIDEGHRALVFSQFTSFLDILETDMRQEGLPFLRLDGSTPVWKRKGVVEGFQNGEGPSVFLLSLKAGGQGLNLTRASYVFHLDPWWNPAVESQASDRAYRIGQTNKVSIFRLLMRHTIEEKMMTLKKRKLALYRAVMEGSMGQKKGISLSKADFDYLLNP